MAKCLLLYVRKKRPHSTLSETSYMFIFMTILEAHQDKKGSLSGDGKS